MITTEEMVKHLESVLRSDKSKRVPYANGYAYIGWETNEKGEKGIIISFRGDCWGYRFDGENLLGIASLLVARQFRYID